MKKVDITKDFKNITKITLHYGLEKIVSIIYEKENKYEIGSKIYDKNNHIYASDYTSVSNNGKGLPIRVIHNVYDKNKAIIPNNIMKHEKMGGILSGDCSECGTEQLWELNMFCVHCGRKLRWETDEN